MNPKRIFIPNFILVFLLGLPGFSQNNVSSSAKYHSTTNSIVKRTALREIGTQRSGHSVPLSKSTQVVKQTQSKEDIALLSEALADINPTVVEQAIKMIGELQIIDLNESILNIYSIADSKYGGYAERVKLAVIDATGNIALQENEEFLDSHIYQEIRDPYIHHVLKAIKKLNATSTIPSLQKLINDYKSKLQRLKDARANPFLISSLQLVIDEANDVLTSLTMNK